VLWTYTAGNPPPKRRLSREYRAAPASGYVFKAGQWRWVRGDAGSAVVFSYR